MHALESLIICLAQHQCPLDGLEGLSRIAACSILTRLGSLNVSTANHRTTEMTGGVRRKTELQAFLALIHQLPP